ncbi:Flagellar hook-length control protein FliK [Bradyrhizobium lablabi]|uniref:Flagellar hook-length control protein FliK n=1 Tax=Bradyrhizobium lablabi TaxID=722472 RepID=A0A1M6Z9G7_9BRAD|nr:Flagellar hook-length control protein FliK [Bradyrhizobium lablabi]
MFSVTSDLAASVSVPTTPPKSVRSDQSRATDSFGALVDSNAAADVSNSSTAPAAQQPHAAPQQSPSPRPSNDNSAPADNSGSRDKAASDQSAGNNSGNSGGATTGPGSDAGANANASQPAATKSGTTKSDTTKSTDKPASGANSTADSSTAPAVVAQPLSITTPNPVAVTIAVAIPTSGTPGATPASGSGSATAPLAIAAAAIAASSQAAPASTSSAQTKIDANAAAAASTTAATATNPDAAAAAKIAVQAAAGEAIAKPVKPQLTPTGATDVATTIAATAPVAPKTTSTKAAVATPAKGATSGTSDATSGTSDSSATAAPADRGNVASQQAAAAKPEAGNGLAAKPDASAGAALTTPAPVTARDHSTVAATANAPTGSSDAGGQVTGAFQPQPGTAATPLAPTGPLSVTAATNAPVPLSGLAVQIAASVKSGKSSFEIRLDPADLGRIDVRINVDTNGNVTSHLTVEKPETLSMLRQDAPQLQQALDDAGFKTGDGGLQFSLRDQSFSGQNGGNDTPRNAQRLVITDDVTIPATVAGQSYGRMLGSSSGVDIRV